MVGLTRGFELSRKCCWQAAKHQTICKRVILRCVDVRYADDNVEEWPLMGGYVTAEAGYSVPGPKM